MSKLITLLRRTGILAGTGLAAYGGIELGEKIGDYSFVAFLERGFLVLFLKEHNKL